ncbi:hypothetical protein IMCC14465_16850 [alpha proteobacterium IMCC14465]|uniref:Uncharacterized protein n=1 Tax=alpha proteobacterium IMCC14465 TaxID=1220535 RepID=J9A2N3_9PROT|nr:hypothetical protein IMCC14465_16850 [alpha proteobacterium IMCC14465]
MTKIFQRYELFVHLSQICDGFIKLFQILRSSHLKSQTP